MKVPETDDCLLDLLAECWNAAYWLEHISGEWQPLETEGFLEDSLVTQKE